MTRNTTEFVFDEEIDRLEQEREDVADRAADLPQDSPAFAQQARRGMDLDRYLRGLRWARDEAHTDTDVPAWDEATESVTLGGLTAGEYGRLQQQLQSDGDDLPERVYDVVAGTVQAPYWNDGATEPEQFAAVGSLPPAFVSWASAQISDLTEVGEGNGKSFGELLADRRATQNGE